MATSAGGRLGFVDLVSVFGVIVGFAENSIQECLQEGHTEVAYLDDAQKRTPDPRTRVEVLLLGILIVERLQQNRFFLGGVGQSFVEDY